MLKLKGVTNSLLKKIHTKIPYLFEKFHQQTTWFSS